MSDVSSNVGIISSVGSIMAAVQMVGNAFGSMASYIKDIVDNAVQLRNLSIATGLSTQSLQKLQYVAETSGTSVQTLATAFNEFNKKAGEARIRGSEMNALFTKLNVNFEDVQNGTYTAMDALKDLAKAQEAGTDSATLAYYGNMMFGSSFQTLLPLIKEGSINLDKYSESVATADEQSAKDAAHLADNLNALSSSIKNIGIDLVGGIYHIFESIRNAINTIFWGMIAELRTHLPTALGGLSEKGASEFFATKMVQNMQSGLSKKEQQDYLAKQTYIMGEGSIKDYIDKATELIKSAGEAGGTAGVKLTPQGLQEARAASTMQAMGGGDIVSAVSFSPADRTADNTEETVNLLKEQNDMISGQTAQKPQSNYTP